MTVSLFGHPIYGGLFSNKEYAELFSVEADIQAMLMFEGELARAQAECSLIPREAADHIYQLCSSFKPDIPSLANGAAIDGILIPDLVKQIKTAVGEEHAQYVHMGATSQDVIDTSLILRLKKVFPKIRTDLEQLNYRLGKLDNEFGSIKFTAHTRMQRALPVQVSDKISTWQQLLKSVAIELDQVEPEILKLQLGGPVGTLHSMGDKGTQVTSFLAEKLGLSADENCWHTNRINLVRFTDSMSHITGALGKIGADIAILSQNEIAVISLSGGGGSSSMPHKNNPVLAEVLISVSKFISVQNSAMHQAIVHENERSGSAWSLEWMVLPQIVAGAGVSLKNAINLLSKVKFHSEDV